MRIRQVAIQFFTVIGLSLSGVAHAQEQIGSVDTEWKLIGPDHKIVVEAYDDPMVAGVSCYVSRPKKGGVTGAIGLVEESSKASIACRQVGKISFQGPVPLSEDVFKRSTSILFKKLHVVRIVDPKRNVLVYLTYSDRLIDGSPENSVTAVPVDASTVIPVKK